MAPAGLIYWSRSAQLAWLLARGDRRDNANGGSPLEQPKKPGARDIGDLKARLGLNRGPAPGGPPPGAPARAPFPGGGPAAPYGGAQAPQQAYPQAPGPMPTPGAGMPAAP